MDRRDFVKLGTKAGAALVLAGYSNHLSAKSDFTGYYRQLGLIESIRSYATQLGLRLNEDFYKNWQPNVANFMYYLYISLPDKVEKPKEVDDYLYMGTEEGLALDKEKEYKDKGYHTLIYKTAGSSVTNLTTVLLSYPMETIAFIAFHEAMHQHIRSHKEHVPYVFEEACCDLIGNYATIEMAHKNKYLHPHRAKKLTRSMETIDKCIIDYRDMFDRKEYTYSKSLYNDCGFAIKNLLPSKNKFFKDRYIYEVNNAYFLRYKNYTQYYFLLHDVLMKKGIRDFISFISAMSSNEELVKEQLINACK